MYGLQEIARKVVKEKSPVCEDPPSSSMLFDGATNHRDESTLNAPMMDNRMKGEIAKKQMLMDIFPTNGRPSQFVYASPQDMMVNSKNFVGNPISSSIRSPCKRYSQNRTG
mmetsp:Transcript_628/g.1208  ORF Transcript_628/g.1208 Transcript_628/m.1208 type:complete len:111 (+) Transcript_628:295-627(+)